MKNLLVFMVILATLPLVFGATGDADITFTVPTPVVYDVPFAVDVNVHTNGVNIISYDLAVGSTADRVSFLTGLDRADTFGPSSLTGAMGMFHRVRTETNGNTFAGTPSRLFTSQRANIEGQVASDSTEITLLTTPQRTITAEPGSVITAVNHVNSPAIIPILSRCGDGVVGYIEIGTPDGIKQQPAESNEACDDGNNLANDGCSAACTYVDLGYSCTNTNFGDRNSVCTRIPHREFLIQKLTALINGQCYPSCTHPAALYVDTPVAAGSSSAPRITYDASGKLDLSEKIYLISQIGVALREFFSQVVVAS